MGKYERSNIYIIEIPETDEIEREKEREREKMHQKKYIQIMIGNFTKNYDS